MIDYDGTLPTKFKADQVAKGSDGRVGSQSSSSDRNDMNPAKVDVTTKRDNDDDVFSDSDGEESVPSRRSISNTSAVATAAPLESGGSKENQIASVAHQAEQLSLGSKESTHFQANTSIENKFDDVERAGSIPNLGSGDIKAIAADASVFSFGDDEDYESE